MTRGPRWARVRELAVAAAVVAVAVAVAAPSARGDGVPGVDRDSVRWRPQAVIAPVDPHALLVRAARARGPSRAGGWQWLARAAGATAAGAVDGAVEVAPHRAAAFVLAGAELARVRVIAGDPAALEIWRQTGAAQIEADGLAAAGTARYLVEPAGPGALYLISATRPTRVRVEWPEARVGRLAWEEARDAARDWLGQGGALPQVPSLEGEPVSVAIDGDARVARLVGRLGGPVAARAVRVWREAVLERALARWRPLSSPFVRHWSVNPGGPAVLVPSGEDGDEAGAGAAADRGPVYHQVPATGVRRLTVEGPGVVRVEARARVTAEGAPLSLWAEQGGAVLASDQGRAWPSHAARPQEPARAALPPGPVRTDQTGAPVSSRLFLAVPLHAGDNHLLLRWQGPTLLRIEVGVRRRRLRDLWSDDGSLDRRLAREARAAAQAATGAAPGPGREALVLASALAGRELGRSGSRASLAHAGGGPDPLAGGHGARLRTDPVLAACAPLASASLAPDRALAWARRIAALARRDAPMARGLALALLERLPHRAATAELASALGTAVRAPVVAAALAHRLSERDGDAAAARAALALGELAFRARPQAAWARRAYLDGWDATHWQRVWPDLTEGDAGGARHDLAVVDRPALPGPDGEPVAAGSAYAVRLGRDAEVTAAPAVGNPSRLAVMRAFVVTPAADPGPVSIAVDGVTHWVVPLSPVTRVNIALSPGRHRVRAGGPDSAAVYLSLPPGPVTRSERLPSARVVARTLWPAAIAGRPLVYRLTGQAGPIEVELRLPASRAGRAGASARVRIATDVGPARRVRVAGGPADPALLAESDQDRLAGPAITTLWLPATARSLRVEAEDGAKVWVAVYERAGRPAPEHPAGATADAESTGSRPATAAPPRSAPPRSAPPRSAPPRSAPPRSASPRSAPPASPRSAPPAPPAPPRPAPPPADPALARLARLSRALDSAPGRINLRAARAQVLLDLGFVGSARRDVDLASRARTRAGSGRTPAPPALSEVVAALSAAGEAHFLAPQPAGSLLVSGTVLDPPLAAVAVAGPGAANAVTALVPVARLARQRGPAAALAALDHAALATPAARALMAELAARAGDEDRAVAELVALRATPACALAALNLLSARLARGGPAGWHAAVAYGLAAELRPRVDHGIVRRALALAAAASRAVPVRGVERSAGFERLTVSATPDQDESPAVQVRRALAGWRFAPWRSHVLGPGDGAGLAVPAGAPRTLRIDATCARPFGGAEPCHFLIRDDRGGLARAERAAGTTGPLAIRALSPGRHQLEVVLEDPDPAYASAASGQNSGAPAIALVRFALGPSPAEVRPLTVVRPLHAFVVEPERPVRASLAGPTAVSLTVRALAATGGTADVLLTGPAGHRRRLSLTLPTRLDTAVSGEDPRGLRVARPASTVMLLPRRGGYQIEVRSTTRAAVGLAVREGGPSRAIEPGGAVLARAARVPGPALALPPVVVTRLVPGAAPAPAPGPLTVSGALSIGRDDLGELESDRQPLRDRIEASVTVRRRLGRTWLLGGVDSRAWRDLSPSAGVRLGMRTRVLPLSLRGGADLRVALQSVAGGIESGVRGAVRLDRSFAVSPSLWLVPAAGFIVRRDSLSDPLVPVEPRVFSQYAHDHPVSATLATDLAALPLQDQRLDLGLEAISNADLASLDQIAGHLTWRGLFDPRWARGRGPVWRLSYHPSLRLADDHRSHQIVRHDMSAGLDQILWRGAWDRLHIGAEANLYLASDGRSARSASLILTWDHTAGRGLDDFAPADQPLDDYTAPRRWSEAP